MGLHLLHQVRVFVDNFANLTLQVCPDLFFVLNDVLSFVQFGLQIIDLRLQLRNLIILILLEICEHLLLNQDLRLICLPFLVQVVDLLLHRLLPFLVGPEFG